jgi:hypothetical protein
MNINKAYQKQTNTGVQVSHQISELKSPESSMGLIGRFQHIIAITDWDEDLLKYEKWINQICWTVIAVSILFFTNVCLSALWM